jgi:heme-degrading monooxygenase HmoA
MLLVATELHVRNFWRFFSFIRHASRSARQARLAEGCLHVWVGNAGWRIGYTLTAWENETAMQQYRNQGAHKEAMKKMRQLSIRYRTLVWEADTVPGWEEAKDRLEQVDFRVL